MNKKHIFVLMALLAGTLTSCSDYTIFTCEYYESINAYMITSAFVTGSNLVIPETHADFQHPEGKITMIGSRAFYDMDNLVSVTISDTVESIGASSFMNCTNLEKVKLGKNVYIIQDSAFQGCKSLTDITLSENLSNISYNAFSDCSSIVYREYDNAYYLGSESNPYQFLVKSKDQSITSCKIHEDTKFIFPKAFQSNMQLTTVDIPDGIEFIGDNAFDDTPALTYSTYNGATYLGNERNPYIYLCSVDESITSFAMPETTRVVGEKAFYDHDKLTSVICSDKLVIIGKRAFESCEGLGTIDLGGSLKVIDERAFYDCNLEKFTFPITLAEIRKDAFKNGLSCIPYYEGSESDWDKIHVIYNGNERLYSSGINYLKHDSE